MAGVGCRRGPDHSAGTASTAGATLEPDQFQSTSQLNVTFLRAVRPGRVTGRGRIVHRDEDLAFLEASLIDSGGAVIAIATATAQVISLSRAPAAA